MGMPLESLGAQRQQMGKWVNQYLRQMKAVMNGQYDLLFSSIPPASEDATEQSSKSMMDVRLRAVLRTKDNAFQVAIMDMKKHIHGIVHQKSQGEVAIGDAVQIQVENQWHSGHVKDIVCMKIMCEEYDGLWSGRHNWRFDKLAMMKEFIRDNRGDELAIFPSYQVFCNLFRQCVDKWGAPTQQLLDAYHTQAKLVSDHVTSELHATSRVTQFIKSTAAEVLDVVVKDAAHEIDTLLRSESRPYTQDQRLFSELDQKRLQRLQNEVEKAVAVDMNGRVLLSDVMKAITAAAPTTDDREAQEMQMALQAYLNVAVPRFADAIPMRVNDLVLCKFVAGMANELNGVTDDKLERMMRDSEQKVATRRRLKNEITCLGNAKKEIEMTF
ncbi:hypothetical protein PHYBOEH_011335 [Phytophthora boehmeriae]|uniref:GED domain-containing protein n=1 Tax=Phytophthora boehmeriae TaxID=109152 RepID=A0A8T1VMT4_9STRA|nr:hypothetical protein PHYBOEH_011335 [Phytophthora boehmeriae]